jgi:SOS regulatory protein LexA
MDLEKKLSKIIRFYRERKRMPTFSELQHVLGFHHKTQAVRTADKLREGEYLDKDSRGKLIPGRLFFRVPLLGEVVAGWPSAADEETRDAISIDEYLIRNREATYMLEVKGDSMKDAGIMDGDTVFVERSRDFKDGDIVIARVDGEFTMKYYRKKGGKIFLEAANKKFGPIYPRESLEIIAVVVAKMRKFKF